jgi:hypothetical protein
MFLPIESLLKINFPEDPYSSINMKTGFERDRMLVRKVEIFLRLGGFRRNLWSTNLIWQMPGKPSGVALLTPQSIYTRQT